MNALANTVGAILIDREENVAVAESVTAGEIQSAFSYCENALQFFEGGLTVYNVRQKIKQLQVDAHYAESCQGVSEKTAAELAVEVAKKFETNWGLSITGYASPIPEQNILQLFAWSAIAYHGNIVSVQKIIAERSAVHSVRKFYAENVFEIFLNVLRS